MDESAPVPTANADTAEPRANPFGALARYVQQASRGEQAALARLLPEDLRPHEIAALSRALLFAGQQPGIWRAETWPRWALVANGMALAGHDGKEKLGLQLARAGVAESRVTRLLTARGDAFRQLLPRVLRLLASKGVRPNWFELGELVIKEGSSVREDVDRAEHLRLRIAGAYFSARAKKD